MARAAGNAPAPASVNARLAALKSLLAYAQRTGYLPLNAGAAQPAGLGRLENPETPDS